MLPLLQRSLSSSCTTLAYRIELIQITTFTISSDGTIYHSSIQTQLQEHTVVEVVFSGHFQLMTLLIKSTLHLLVQVDSWITIAVAYEERRG